ncbi:C2 domain [Trinorchestia longiramus]|nr:C2 domain [Trinorchestia longiramus]
MSCINFGIFSALAGTGTSDPYVKFKVNGKLGYKSKIVHKDLNPTWDESFVLHVEDPFEPVQLKVFDYDWGMQDDFMGEANIDLTSLDLNQSTDLELTLSDPGKEENMGKLYLSVQLSSRTQEEKDLAYRRLCLSNKIQFSNVNYKHDLELHPNSPAHIFQLNDLVGNGFGIRASDERLSGNSVSSRLSDERLTGNSVSNRVSDERLTGNSVSSRVSDERLTGNSVSSRVSDERLTGNSVSSRVSDECMTGYSVGSRVLDERLTGNSVNSRVSDECMTGYSVGSRVSDERLTGNSVNSPHQFTSPAVNSDRPPDLLWPNKIGCYS